MRELQAQELMVISGGADENKSDLGNTISSLVNGIKGIFSGDYKSAVEAINNIIKTTGSLLPNIGDMFKPIANFISGLFGGNKGSSNSSGGTNSDLPFLAPDVANKLLGK